ncbi:hypothetical protein MCAG_04308 [Micromonospora sp. ATCC 39149]|uniref:Trm112 family protein n=1 Tax=Micromonospora carbonacea TaxID=47853 RepID=A0A7D5Y9Y5_9ACTN|nr:Trm112 family protein [Micromonospora sp. ATCC 39149]EEP73981.1 hypothetical protein MCAG_04308 [Micromonospora sp. ATCC 39149]QLJ99859.1 Trm112 family protein [Micromonospora carbonacea]
MPDLALDPDLLDVLACPDTDHAPLRAAPDGRTLTCTGCGRVYDVVDGIPVLLLDRGRPSGGATGEDACDA